MKNKERKEAAPFKHPSRRKSFTSPPPRAPMRKGIQQRSKASSPPATHPPIPTGSAPAASSPAQRTNPPAMRRFGILSVQTSTTAAAKVRNSDAYTGSCSAFTSVSLKCLDYKRPLFPLSRPYFWPIFAIVHFHEKFSPKCTKALKTLEKPWVFSVKGRKKAPAPAPIFPLPADASFSFFACQSRLKFVKNDYSALSAAPVSSARNSAASVIPRRQKRADVASNTTAFSSSARFTASVTLSVPRSSRPRA